MSAHLHTSLLKLFLQGELDDDAVVEVAMHLDSCPSCAATCARLDPLVAELSLLADPSPPADLAMEIVAAANAPSSMQRADIAVGVSLIALAAILGLAVGDVLHPLFELGVLARVAWSSAGHVVGSTLLLIAGTTLSTVVAIAAALGAARMSLGERAL